jgi:dimethylargininase
MHIALTREISPAMARCELTHLARVPIDLDAARAQHAAYERALTDLGCAMHRLASGPEMPDAVFIEDTAVVLDEVAVITRPGAGSRRPETEAVTEALSRYRPLHAIGPPGTLDGGDVLRIGRRLFVGASGRTNAAGIAQLRTLLDPYGYTVEAVPVRGCLHLKTAVTAVGEALLLLNPDWIDPAPFVGFEVIEVALDEPFAANALLVGETILFAAHCPRTRDRLEQRGLRVRPVPADELAKAEGGVTCCSLIFSA